VCGLNRYAILFLALMLSSMLLMSACRNRVDDSDLVNAWTLCEALEYEEAFPIVREYLFLHPDNSVAHYLLGKCYQQRENPALTLAKGELDMALFLFDRDGDLSVLSEAMTGSEYRATLHCDIVLVLLRTIIEAEEQGMPPNAGIPILRIALEHARKAAYFNPESAFILDLTQTLESMLDAAESSPKSMIPDIPQAPDPKPVPASPQGTWTA
jgi:tetratricopeptide (TPR) repeat protein